MQIRFRGEQGIDMGGLEREFYSIMGEYFKNEETKIFDQLEN